jgi:hypothetical protein
MGSSGSDNDALVQHQGEHMYKLVAAVAAIGCAIAGAAFGDKLIQNGEWTYTSTSECNADNTKWTVTNCCSCTVGGNTATLASLQTAIQFGPVQLGPPVVTVTDLFGNPIFIDGALLVFEPSDAVTAKVTQEQGVSVPGQKWFGFQSNVPVRTNPGTNGFVYRVSFEWPSPVDVQGATWFSDTSDEAGFGTVVDAYSAIPPAPGTPLVNGIAETGYGPAIVEQNVQTNFGDSNLGQIGFANGSELNGGFGFVDDGFVWITLAGNLESNFNKLEVFLDYTTGGQNKLRGDNADVDFNGLNRMGDDGSGNGLRFDDGFEADYYLTVTCGNNPFTTFANVATLPTGGNGLGRFIGAGGAGGGSGVLYGANGVLIGLNNSNTAGVGGGTGAASGAGVFTGIEFQIPRHVLPGYEGGPIRVSAFINGGGHDFVSNQVLGGLGRGTGNLGEPRFVDFNAAPGEQFFTIPGAPVPCVGDFDGDGDVGGADLAILLGGWGSGTGDLDGDGTTGGADLAILLGAWGSCS